MSRGMTPSGWRIGQSEALSVGANIVSGFFLYNQIKEAIIVGCRTK